MLVRVSNVISAVTMLRLLAARVNVANGDIGYAVHDVSNTVHDGRTINMPT